MLTAEQIKLLKDPFAIEDHEHREGGKDGLLTYLTEEPVIDRLNEVDPSWSFRVVSILMSNYGGDRPDTVTVHGELTLCDITRANVGTAVATVKTHEWVERNGRKEKVKLDKPDVQPLAEMDIKGAVTDALKRCARMFGVGGYLLRLKGVKIANDADFARWYRQQFGGPPTADPAPADRRIPTGANGQRDGAEPPAKRESIVDKAQTDGEFQQITWTRDEARVRNFAEEARNFWLEEGKPKMVYSHLYQRLAEVLHLTANPRTFDEFHIAMMNECAVNALDAWRAVQLYEPKEKPAKKAPATA